MFSVQTRAQLSTYVSERGALVFTNADLPAPRPSAPKTKPVSARPPAPAPKPPAPVVAASPRPAPPPAPAPQTTTRLIETTPFSPAASSLISSRSVAPPAYDRIVLQAAQKHNVDPKLIRAVIATESSWNSMAVSRKGAQGLMQLIPGTARQLGVGNPFDPAQNVDGGTQYLGMLLARYNGDVGKALAAYNAGPGAVDRFGGVPNYPETREYVRKVTSTYFAAGSAGGTSGQEPTRRIYRTTDSDGRLVFTNE